MFKGGSLGHGTAVPGKFDIDLVLYSRSKPKTIVIIGMAVCLSQSLCEYVCCAITPGLTIKKATEDGYEEYFDEMNSYLNERLRGQYTHDDFTNVAIKFSIQPPGEYSIDIDLILSPYFSDHDELLRSLTAVKPPSMRLQM